ncbi:MAG: hypothetical protein HYZ27_08965, partial [Deltaproteobacteria bacterium]|nr:hypothetical protein [Deltaproteobacteria bacterium]
LGRHCWYTLTDGPDLSVFPPEAGFGLLAYDPDPLDATPAAEKEAYRALATLISIAGDSRYAADRRDELGLDADQYAFALAGPRGRITVLWAHGKDAHTSLWLGAGPGAALCDLFGACRWVQASALVALDEAPQYLVEPR